MRYFILSLILVACQATAQLPQQAMLVDTPLGSGTCFPISEDDYLTAWHIVHGSTAAQVTVDGEPIDEIIRLPDVDGALLRVYDGHGHNPWKVDEEPLESGEEILLSGYGAMSHWWTRGIASGDNRASLSICPGDSGGPLRDAKGAVRGVVVGQGLYAQHHTWFIPIGDLMAAIRRHQSSLQALPAQ